jgi:hypothetical protein
MLRKRKIGGKVAIRNVREQENGAAYVTRTRDPIITNDVLYRLS